MSDAIGLIYDKLSGWWESAVAMFPNFIVAVIVVILFGIISKFTRKILKKTFSRFIGSVAISNLFSNTASLLILVAGVVIALGILDLQKTVTSLLAGVGIIGLALGFAFQEIAANFISGIVLSVNKPFIVGDIVEIQETFGKIEHVTLRTTNIRTFDGQKVMVPNKLVFQAAIVNFTENRKRRIDLPIGISYGEDLEKVEKVVLDTVNKLSVIKKGEPVQFFYVGYGDSSINFEIRFWTDYIQKHAEYMEARHQAVKAIKKAFDENNIVIPFPIRTLDFGIKGGEKLAAMTSKTPLSIKTKNE